MPMITLTVPAAMKEASKVHTPYGVVTVTGGTITVDARAARTLQKIGCTAATLPDMTDTTHAKTRSMNVPAGSNIGSINVSGAASLPVVAGVVNAPLDLVPALVEAGFTV